MSNPTTPSEVVAHYPVSSVSTIRIACHHQGCGAVIELPAAAVEGAMKKTGACCPLCGKPFTKPDVEGGADMVTQFARAVLALNNLAPQFGIELPVRASDSGRS